MEMGSRERAGLGFFWRPNRSHGWLVAGLRFEERERKREREREREKERKRERDIGLSGIFCMDFGIATEMKSS
jgi:hypothetical protein